MTAKPRNTNNLNYIRRQKIDAGTQPFRLVKYFSFSSILVFLVFTLFLSYALSKYSEKVMFEQSEAHTILLAENINQQVFHRFVLPTVLRYGKISLREPEQHKLINRIVIGLIQGMAIDRVTIYDSNVNIVSYSTEEGVVGQEGLGQEGYALALLGQTKSTISYGGNVFTFLGIGEDIHSTLTTTIPFRQVGKTGESNGEILGVIEIKKDLTREYANILDLQKKLVLLSTVVVTILFLVLRTIVARGDRIMIKRTEERLRLEDKLNQAERLATLGTMVATVSHEIKSPLGIVRSTAEILEKRIKKIAPGSEHLAGIIIDETTRLNDIVLEFLDFARPQKMQLRVAAVEDVVDKILRFVSPEMKASNIKLITDFAPDLPKTALDEDAFYRAILNVVMNALQAMEEGGELQITTENLGKDGLSIAIQDSGRGISEENQDQVFTPFFTDRHKGTGLGLAITKNIIENHGGSIKLDSELDKGSCFTISLPKTV